MEKSKKHYWAIFENKEAIFEGSFNDCWKELTFRFADQTVESLKAKGIRISRLA